MSHFFLPHQTTEEYHTRYATCYQIPDAVKINSTIMKYNSPRKISHLKIPDTVDWRTKSAVTGIKDQVSVT